MPGYFNSVSAVIIGAVTGISVTVLLVKLGWGVAVIGAVVLPLLAGLAFHTADNSAVLWFTLFISAPTLLALAVVWLQDWSWISLELAPFVCAAVPVGLIVRRQWSSSRFWQSAVLTGAYTGLSAATLFVAVP